MVQPAPFREAELERRISEVGRKFLEFASQPPATTTKPTASPARSSHIPAENRQTGRCPGTIRLWSASVDGGVSHREQFLDGGGPGGAGTGIPSVHCRGSRSPWWGRGPRSDCCPESPKRGNNGRVPAYCGCPHLNGRPVSQSPPGPTQPCPPSPCHFPPNRSQDD